MQAVDAAMKALDRWEAALATGDERCIAECKRQYDEIEDRACTQVEAFARMVLGQQRWQELREEADDDR